MSFPHNIIMWILEPQIFLWDILVNSCRHTCEMNHTNFKQVFGIIFYFFCCFERLPFRKKSERREGECQHTKQAPPVHCWETIILLVKLPVPIDRSGFVKIKTFKSKFIKSFIYSYTRNQSPADLSLYK